MAAYHIPTSLLFRPSHGWAARNFATPAEQARESWFLVSRPLALLQTIGYKR